MKRIALLTAAFVLVCAAACKQEKKSAPAGPAPAEETPVIDTVRTETFAEAKDMEMRGRYHVDYSFSMEYVVDERLDPVVRDSMNCAIAQAMFGRRDPQVEELALANEGEVREWFEDGIWEDDADEEEELELMMTEGYWKLSGDFSHTAPEGFTNYNIAGEEYMFGAAHGYYYFKSIVLDLSTGRRLRQEELFREGFEKNISSLLLHYLAQDEYYVDGMLFDDEPVMPNNNFLLTKDGISFFFNPYEIAAYVFGIIQIDIPAADLKPLLAGKYAHLWDE